VPPKSAPNASGSVVKKAAIPVFVALPVVSRTNHGTATVASTLPMSETAFAAIRTSNGSRRVMSSAFPRV
jgi:hypothetical protein